MNHYYVYTLRRGRYYFERTTATEQSADDWIAIWKKRGFKAVWLLNHLIRKAFY